MNEILALAGKDLRLLLRDKPGFFFAFIFPIIYACLFGSIIAGMSGARRNGLRVAVVDEDGTPNSEAFIKELDDLDELAVTKMEREQAQDLVRRGKQLAMIVLPKGFGEKRDHLFGDAPTVQLGVDPSRLAESGMLQGILTAQMYRDIQSVFTNPSIMNERLDSTIAQVRSADDMDALTKTSLLAFLPAVKTFMKTMPTTPQGGDASKNGESENAAITGFPQPKVEKIDIAREQKGPTNAYEITFPQGIVWGIMGCSAGFGISLVVERTRGTLVRLRMAPISMAQVLAGKGLACLITTLGVGCVLFLLGVIAFDVRPNSYLMLFVALICVAIAFVGIMMLLSVLGKTEQSAGGIGWAILVVMAMIGGGMIPLAFMPEWLQTFSVVSPVKWAILAMEGAVWRDFTAIEMLKPCAVLVGIGLTCFIIGARAFKWTA